MVLSRRGLSDFHSESSATECCLPIPCSTYTVESQLNVASIQRGSSLVKTDDVGKVFKGGIDFHTEAAVLPKKRCRSQN